MKSELAEALRGHDWTYQYSDDPRVLRQGRKEAARLRLLFEQIDPPFTMAQGRAWAQDLVVSLFEPPPGEAGAFGLWKRRGTQYDRCYRNQLIAVETFEQIQRWFDEKQQ